MCLRVDTYEVLHMRTRGERIRQRAGNVLGTRIDEVLLQGLLRQESVGMKRKRFETCGAR